MEQKEIKLFKKDLPVDLTDVELLEKAKELAKLQQDKVSHEEQAKSAAATFKDKIASAQSNINIISRDISNGYEYRETDCYWDFHYKTKVKHLIRTDTGEIVRTDNLTASELQENMPIE